MRLIESVRLGTSYSRRTNFIFTFFIILHRNVKVLLKIVDLAKNRSSYLLESRDQYGLSRAAIGQGQNGQAQFGIFELRKCLHNTQTFRTSFNIANVSLNRRHFYIQFQILLRSVSVGSSTVVSMVSTELPQSIKGITTRFSWGNCQK